MTESCPYCGRPDSAPYQRLGNYPTHEGETVWTRCACGSLQGRVLDRNGLRVVTRGRPAMSA